MPTTALAGSRSGREEEPQNWLPMTSSGGGISQLFEKFDGLRIRETYHEDFCRERHESRMCRGLGIYLIENSKVMYDARRGR